MAYFKCPLQLFYTCAGFAYQELKAEPGQQNVRHGNPTSGGGALGGGGGAATESDNPVSHWRTRLTLNIVSDHFQFDKESLPSDVHRYLRV